MVLANLAPHLRSKTDNFKLVALCREKFITRFGWEPFLKPLIDDLNILETEGITISVAGESQTFLGIFKCGNNWKNV